MHPYLVSFFLLCSASLSAQVWTGLTSSFSPPEVHAKVESGSVPGEYHFTLTIPPGYYQDKDSPFFRLEAQPPFQGMELMSTLPTSRQGKESYQGTVTLTLRAIPPNSGPVPGKIQLVTGYQICQEDGICLLPVEETHTLPWNGTPESFPKVELLEGWQNWLLQLVFAFLGGLLLNLMPCVFPLLSVKSLALVKNRGAGENSAKSLAWWYAGGIMASLLAVAAFMMVLKATGEAAGWGFYFQNPGFVLFLTTLLWAFALSLLGLFTLPAAGLGTAGLSTPQGSFVSGLFAVLAAAPCTAPFLGSAMGFAFSQSLEILPLFFLLAGAGFALPYVLLAHLPKLLKKIPKPGAWMETFERLMGFLLAGWALVTLSTLQSQIPAPAFWPTVGYLFTVALVLWILGRWARAVDPINRRRLLWILGSLIILSGGYLTTLSYEVPETPEVSTEKQLSEGWENFSPEALNQALASGQPVFVDIWAQWCTNCKINEALVLSRPEVLQALDKAGVRRFKGDLTRPNPVLTDFLADHGRAGLPFYGYFVPGQSPRILPELLTPSLIMDLVEP